MKSISVILIFLAFAIQASFSHDLGSLIPVATATHVAQQSGNWFSASTWQEQSVPGEGAIVHIPADITVTYEGVSEEHIFAIRVDGTFRCVQNNLGQTTKLIIDTYIGTDNSVTKFTASNAAHGNIDIIFKAFDIEEFKMNSSLWNPMADNHFVNNSPVTKVSRKLVGSDRYNSYQEALDGDTEIVIESSTPVPTELGILGRYTWDPEQLSLGLVTMGEIVIRGKQKTNMQKLSTDALKGQSQLHLENIPSNWEEGDTIVITMDGNQNTNSRGDDIAVINSINGTQIGLESNLDYNHIGRSEDQLHCYVGNLSRNVTFRSFSKKIRQRGHLMVMHNDTNIKIKNAAFLDMGRTNKAELLDDSIWEKWVETKIFKSKYSALGQEVAQTVKNPINEVTNTRGRYSIHLHRTGASFDTNIAEVTGNVVWRNPGWGITQHHAYANVSDNVVYDVIGSGIVSESGSEIGFWDNNLVANIQKGHERDPYESMLHHDDYLFSGQGLGMKGRAVFCRGNVIANAVVGVGVMNMNPIENTTDRVDAKALATLRPGYVFDQFPLDQNGYSSEGDGIVPVEVALIFENTTIIWCNQGLRSIERDMGVNHESRSVFDDFIVWGANQGLSITYQADYTFRDVFVSGKNPTKSIGAFLWKHSHNHVFENIKMVDLKYGVTVSKLVTSGNGLLKTRNNGFTPWYFIDLVTQNVDELYEIANDDPGDTAPYTEHGDNVIHLLSTELTDRPVTFTILDSSKMNVDYAAEDLRFEVDGVITDQLGSYHFGIEQAPAQGTLRLGYPSRIYEFASKAKLDEYLTNNGVYKTEENKYYFILNEIVPDRSSFEYYSFPIRIEIKNAPTSGIFSGAILEAAEHLEPQNHLISREAIVCQSSNQNNVIFQDSLIKTTPIKAVDGNINGRINVQYYQQGLVPIGSFSQTEVELEPWYELDLKEEKVIDFIDVWNTVEIEGSNIETLSSHFDNFYILISKVPFGSDNLSEARQKAVYEFHYTGGPKRKLSLNDLNVEGRYVRIQKEGTGFLKFAEIEIIGKRFEGCNVVRNGLNSGLGSLRNAIQCAQPGDTIFFRSELSGKPITINSSELKIDKNLAISATPSQFIIINSAISELFTVMPNTNVFLEGLNLSLSESPNAVAIRNKGTLKVKNVSIIHAPN